MEKRVKLRLRKGPGLPVILSVFEWAGWWVVCCVTASAQRLCVCVCVYVVLCVVYLDQLLGPALPKAGQTNFFSAVFNLLCSV